MITGSALPRLLNCPASAVLPRAETASPYAEAGHDEHAELAAQVLAGTLDEKLAAAIPPNPRVEVKMVYDVATREGRFIGEASDRNYGAPGPFEIFLSADVIGIEGNRVVVLDFKTGFADVEPAATNGQLWGLALAACRALGLREAIVRIAYTNRPGVPIDEYVIDALELANFGEQLARLHTDIAALAKRRAAGETLNTREGSWCRYCASKSSCPSKVGLLVQLAEKGLAVIGDTVMTPERARSGYEQLVAVEQLVRDARARLETYVDEQGPIDLGNGRRFGRYVRSGNERLSGDVAVQAIAEVIGESSREFEAIAVERKTTKAAIDRAAKTLGCKRGAAPAVIKRIRELGGASHAPDSLPIGEYAKDRNEAAEKPAIDTDAVNALLEGA